MIACHERHSADTYEYHDAFNSQWPVGAVGVDNSLSSIGCEAMNQNVWMLSKGRPFLSGPHIINTLLHEEGNVCKPTV